MCCFCRADLLAILDQVRKHMGPMKGTPLSEIVKVATRLYPEGAVLKQEAVVCLDDIRTKYHYPYLVYVYSSRTSLHMSCLELFTLNL